MAMAELTESAVAVLPIVLAVPSVRAGVPTTVETPETTLAMEGVMRLTATCNSLRRAMVRSLLRVVMGCRIVPSSPNRSRNSKLSRLMYGRAFSSKISAGRGWNWSAIRRLPGRSAARTPITKSMFGPKIFDRVTAKQFLGQTLILWLNCNLKVPSQENYCERNTINRNLNTLPLSRHSFPLHRLHLNYYIIIKSDFILQFVFTIAHSLYLHVLQINLSS